MHTNNLVDNFIENSFDHVQQYVNEEMNKIYMSAESLYFHVKYLENGKRFCISAKVMRDT